MRNTKKVVSLGLSAMIALSSVTALAADGDFYNLDKTKYATSSEVLFNIEGKGNPVLFNEGAFMYELEGKLYRMQDVNAMYNVNKNDFKNLLKNNYNGVPIEAETGDLKVVEVSAINAEEIQVAFNQNVDGVSASKIAAYEVKVNNITRTLEDTIEVEDNKVLIRLNGTTLKVGDIVVVQANDSIKSSNGQKLDRYASEQIVYGVRQEAKILQTSVNTSTKVLKVKFDRPVNTTTGLIKIDGVALSLATTFTLVPEDLTEAGNYTYTISLVGTAVENSAITEGSHEVVIFDVKDTASLNPVNASSLSSNYTVSKDTLAPSVVAVTPLNSNKFFIQFNKAASLDAIDSLQVKKGNHEFTTVAGNVAPSATSSVYFEEGYYLGKPGVYVVVTKDSVSGDLNPLYSDTETSVTLNVTLENYKVANTSLIGSKYQGAVTLSQADNKPVIKNAITNGNQFEITFGNNVSAINTADVVVRDKDGIITTATGAPFATADLGKTVIIPIANANKAPYTVEFKADKFKYNDNLSDVSDYVVAGKNNDRLVVTPIANNFKLKLLTLSGANVTVTSNTIDINYATPMDNSALNVANYKLDGKVLPAGSTVDFVGNNEMVRITLPASTIVASTNYKLTVSTDVKTTANEYMVGDLQAKTSAETIIALTDNVKPTLSSAKYIVNSNIQSQTNQIELKFSETMNSSTNGAANNFVVTVNGSTQTVSSVVVDSIDASKVRLTLAANVNVDQTATIIIKAKNNVNDVKDTAGNKAVEGTSTTTIGKEIDLGAVQQNALFAASTVTGVSASDITGAGNDDKATVNWTALANATSYTITATSAGETTVTKTVTGQATATTNLDGLTPTKAYAVTVVASNGSVNSQAGTATVTPLAYIAATSGTSVGTVVIADDTALAALTTSQDSNTLIYTIDGVVKTYTIANTVITKADFLSALNSVLGTAGTASFNTSNELVVTSATTGALSTVAATGTAATAIVGTPVETTGQAAQN